MSRVSSLFRLQELDSEIDRSQIRIADIRTILEDDEERTRATQALQTAEAKLNEARTANSSAEHAVESQRQKIEQTDSTLYGGGVTNPKELQDLQMESESLRRYLQTLEERYLEAMLELDAAQEEFDTAQLHLSKIDARLEEQHSELSQEKETSEESIQNRQSEREAVLADISADDLELYENLRAKLGGIAIAKVQEDACAACGMDQARSKLQEIRSGTVLVRCSQCNRILYSG